MELKIGTINLNGNSFRFAFQPKIPNRAYDRNAIKNNMFMILMEGIEKILTHYDIIAVQELISEKKYLNILEAFISQNNYKLIYAPIRNAHFLSAFIVSENIKTVLNNFCSNRFLSIEANYNNKKIILVNVHIQEFDYFTSYINDINSENVILLGDFNAYTKTQTEQKEFSEKTQNNINAFTKFKEESSYIELGNDNQYTYSISGYNKKLDHIFVSKIFHNYEEITIKNESVNFTFDTSNGFTDHSMLTSTFIFKD